MAPESAHAPQPLTSLYHAAPEVSHGLFPCGHQRALVSHPVPARSRRPPQTSPPTASRAQPPPHGLPAAPPQGSVPSERLWGSAWSFPHPLPPFLLCKRWQRGVRVAPRTCSCPLQRFATSRPLPQHGPSFPFSRFCSFASSARFHPHRQHPEGRRLCTAASAMSPPPGTWRGSTNTD